MSNECNIACSFFIKRCPKARMCVYMFVHVCMYASVCMFACVYMSKFCAVKSRHSADYFNQLHGLCMWTWSVLSSAFPALWGWQGQRPLWAVENLLPVHREWETPAENYTEQWSNFLMYSICKWEVKRLITDSWIFGESALSTERKFNWA